MSVHQHYDHNDHTQDLPSVDWASAPRQAHIHDAMAANPPRVGDGYDDDPTVGHAWRALTTFGADMDRATAALLLSFWALRRELSEQESRAVLIRFPLPPDTPPGSWLRFLDPPLSPAEEWR